jgi:hypothetical protein
MKDLLFDFISKYIRLSEDEKEGIISLNIFRCAKKRTILLREGQCSKDAISSSATTSVSRLLN